MKRLLTIMVIAISLNAAAQTTNSISFNTQSIDTTFIKFLHIGDKKIAVSDIFKKDTVALAIYVFERTDTASKLASILYEGKKNRIYKTQGYYIYKTQVATTDGKNYKQASQPVIIGALDEKRKPVKLISQ